MTKAARACALVLVLVVGFGCDGGSATRSTRVAITLPRRRPIAVPSITTSVRTAVIDPHDWYERWRTTPGVEKVECVRADWMDSSDVRSGEFIAGNFRSFADRWTGDLEGSKLYYVPAHPSDAKPDLDVTVWHADDPLDRGLHYRFPAYAWSSAGTPFYVSGTVLPRPGKWRIFASAGRDSGCFDIQVG